MRNFKQVDEKHSFSLDNRQIAFLATGVLSLFLLFFLLGVLYGSRLGSRQSGGAAPVAEAVPPPVQEEAPTSGMATEDAGTTDEAPAPEPSAATREHIFRLNETDIQPDESAALEEEIAKAEPVKAAPASRPASTSRAAPPPPPPPPPAPKPATSKSGQLQGRSLSSMSGNYTIQVGSFTAAGDARKVQERFSSKGYPAFVAKGDVRGTTYYRVRIGRFQTREEASRHADVLKRAERTDTLVTQVE